MRDKSRGRRWSRILRRNPRTEVDDELAFHLEERVRDYMARGMDLETARAAALERLGDLENVRRECTDMLTAERRIEGRRTWMKFSWLDFKLGFRMLVRYPGLTVIGGLAIAFAVWVGAGTFELVTQLVNPTLPLPEGDRVVGIWNRDATAADTEGPTLHDFATWRAELDAIDDLGAFRTVERNLIIGDGAGEIIEGGTGEPVEVAQISASAFDLTRIPPLLGRSLIEADEDVGAPPVAVIGYELWHRRFAADPDVVGRTVALGRTQATIVGVMPEGFAFPVDHGLWVPLRLDVLNYSRAESPHLQVFGRLAPGATLEEAQAELATLGRRVAADFPETHEHLRPQVIAYADAFFPIGDMTASAGMYWFNLAGVMLMLLMCGNVALLLFARAATREGELVVRNALGASRGRIITQLFTEALVLGGVAAVVGLAAAGFGLRWAYRLLELNLIQLPFWFDASVSPVTVLYVAALTVLGAVVAGVVPALKVTGKAADARLRQASAGGGGGFRFGGIWTAVIVTQVAATLAFPVPAFFLFRMAVQIQTADVGFAEEEYLSARLEMDRNVIGCGVTPCNPLTAEGAEASRAAFVARVRATKLELERRLLAEPGVLGVTFAEDLPRMSHPATLVELDAGGAAAPDSAVWELERRGGRALGYTVSSTSVAPDFFEVLGTEILAGRGFHPADLESDQRVVVVNESFVREVLGGRHPIGRRLRDVLANAIGAGESPAEPGPWHEIVGVVPDLAMGNLVALPTGDDPNRYAGLYQPLTPDAAGVHVAVRLRGDPAAFAPRLLRLAASVDPSLRLYDIMPLADASAGLIEFAGLFLRIILMVSAVALLLSLAGIYAVMSFTVSQRTREIGVRIALGAERKRLAAAIFRRPLRQLGLGIIVGGALVGMMAFQVFDAVSAGGVALLMAYAALMTGVCMLACIVPTRRALRVEPTEALRADG